MVRDFLHDEAMDGHERILKRYLEPDLLIIDDMGMKQLPKRNGEYLFEVIMRRHDVRSTMMTSNRPLEEWGKVDWGDHGPELPNGEFGKKFKQYQSANRVGDRRSIGQTVPTEPNRAPSYQLVPFEAPMTGTVSGAN
jgi:hypothetical protein